jgi:hypothetical protein
VTLQNGNRFVRERCAIVIADAAYLICVPKPRSTLLFTANQANPIAAAAAVPLFFGAVSTLHHVIVE